MGSSVTMVSFRLEQAEAEELAALARDLGVARSALLREAVHRQIVRLRAESEIAAWEALPLTEQEASLEEVSDWGPDEDWSEWTDAKG